MLLFDGLPIFGNVITCNTERAVARQVTAYPGLNGLDILNMGGRGRRTRIEGWHAAPDPFDLATLQDIVDAYVLEGMGHVFIDAKGRAYSDVILESFTTVGPTYPDAAFYGGYCQKYQARLLHAN